MEMRNMAAIGIALWFAGSTTLALAAEDDRPGAKSAPPTGETKDAKPRPDAKVVKPAGPRLQMAEHPGRNPGKDRDLRHCLDLPTPKEVIRCSEQK